MQVTERLLCKVNYIVVKKIYSLFLPLLLIVALGDVVSAQTGTGRHTIKKVVLDAGHGGHDPGAIGYTGSKEKDVALAVTLMVGKYINQYLPDVEVIYTRDKDEFIPLYERAKIANDAKADLFISIHADAFSKPTVYGTEVFVLGLHKHQVNLEVALRENQVVLKEENYKENYEGYDPNSPEDYFNNEKYIIKNMQVNGNIERSLDVAHMVEDQFVERVNRKSRGVKQAGFIVLHQTAMPSLLVEIGFISNKNEENYLNTKQGRDYIASAIFRAFRDYKVKVEKGPAIPEGRSSEPEVVEIPAPPKDTYEAPEEEAPVEVVKDVAVVEPPAPKGNATGVTFKVQIMATKTLLPKGHAMLKGVNDYEIEKSPSGYNRYICGSFDNYDETLNLQYQLKQKGHRDAYIVAYQKGSRIPITKALELVGEN